MYPGAPKHPIFSGSTFGLMSGEKPLFQPQVHGGHEALGSLLTQMGLHAEPTSGKYKEPERSYIIHNPSLEQMQKLGKLFGQESVVHSQNGQHRLVYTNGEHEGKYHQADPQVPVEHFEQPPPDFYTSIPGHGHMRINFDWNKLHSSDPVQKADRELTVDQASRLAKNAIAQLLQAHVPVLAHPHFYDWHDGHTEHHKQDLGGPQLPGLAKASETHPHMDAPPKAPEADYNDQSAKAGASTYKQFALPFGNVQPGKPSNLLHYPYHGKLPEIEKLVADHGYKTYYAGGKYGKPDLASKNYNTGHLMVYDPSAGSGGDFGHEAYTKGWRQIHELAHALTYPELNKIYGEGRRIGKLGTHRTMNEALRAVHWEWLAAHKQRELSKQVGINVKDEDFNRELNTVMHDAAHRAVTGKFTEPSGEGFVPHQHKVPLHTALQMVRDAGHQMGLRGLHETLGKNPVQKAERLVTIYSAEGDTSVADEKTYTPDEANALLLKATREKVFAFEKEIQALRERELKKALIPTHRHNESMQSSAGIEDVPPGKANPKGLDKNATMGYGENGAASGGSNGPVAGPSTTPLAMAEACAKCGDMHKPMEKCMGKKLIEKADLHSEKGRRTDNHTVPTSKLPDNAKEKQVNEGTDKNPASGGIVLPGAHLKSTKNKQPINQKVEGKPSDLITKAETLSKPPVSQAQRGAMGAAAGGNSTLGIPKSVGKEFMNADKGGKLPKVKKEELDMEKAAMPPMAKPPSGKNMGTSVPTSTPKAPMAPTMKAETKKADTWAGEGVPEKHEIKLPGAHLKTAKPQFTATNLAAGKQNLAAQGVPPGGLASPKTAGVTRAPVTPKPITAMPVQNAARPAMAKPGIFGKLFGKAEVKADKVKCEKCGDAHKTADHMAAIMAEPMPKVLHPSDKKGKKK